MALGALPDLLAINAELGLTNQGSLECIAAAGKTGIWTNQLDFAYYVKPSIAGTWIEDSTIIFNDIGTARLFSVNTFGYGWTLESKPSWIFVTPASGGTGNTAITVDPTSNVGRPARTGTIVFRQTTTLYSLLMFVEQESGL